METLTGMGVFESHICAEMSESGQKLGSAECTGSMKNAKRHAKILADKLGLKPTINWIVKRSDYAPGSGCYGSWESSAVRRYTDIEGNSVTIKIYRS